MVQHKYLRVATYAAFLVVSFSYIAWSFHSIQAQGKGDLLEIESISPQSAAAGSDGSYQQYADAVREMMEEEGRVAQNWKDLHSKGLPKNAYPLPDTKNIISTVAIELGWINHPVVDKKFLCSKIFPGNPITNDEETALSNYASGGFRIVNAFLRGKYDAKSKAVKDHFISDGLKNHSDGENAYQEFYNNQVTLINSSLNKLPVYPGALLYRYAYFEKEYVQDLVPGKVFQELGFISTSKNLGPAYLYWADESRATSYGDKPSRTERVLFVTKHLTGRDVSAYSGKCYEDEAMITNGKVFKVIKHVEPAEHGHIIYIEEQEK